MKRIICILSVMTLLFCAAALGETDLQQLIDNNNIGKAKDTYPAIAQHATLYDPSTGDVVQEFTGALVVDAEAGPTYYFIYDTGLVNMYSRDMSVGYDAESDSLYLFGFISTAFDEFAAEIDAANWGEFFDGQSITGEEMTSDGKLLITTQGVIPADYSPFGETHAGETMVAYHTVDPDSLIMYGSFAGIPLPDGNIKPLRVTELEFNPTFELPFDIDELKNPEKPREIRVVMNPGTDEESENVLSAPLDVVMYLYVPEGYGLYDDISCTTPVTYAAPDENGSYPESATVYCAPVKE